MAVTRCVDVDDRCCRYATCNALKTLEASRAYKEDAVYSLRPRSHAHLKATAWRLRHVLGLSLSFPAASRTLSILHPTAAMAAVIARWLCNPRKSRSTTASFQVSGRWVEVLFGLGAQCYDLPIAAEIIPDPFRHGSYVRRPCFVTGDIPPRGLDKRFSLVEGVGPSRVHGSCMRRSLGRPSRTELPDLTG